MTAAEIHDGLWLYHGEELVNGGVDGLEACDVGRALELVLRSAGRPDLDMTIERAAGIDLMETVLYFIPNAIMEYWAFRCHSCGQYYLRQGAEMGRQELDDDLAVCDLCAEVVAAAREALEGC
jgi:hypothetical protein